VPAREAIMVRSAVALFSTAAFMLMEMLWQKE
jgi:hypothetical protein